MMIVLCECNWGIDGLPNLPPHYHYTAGLVTMPDGREKWVPGVISGGINGADVECEQRQFIHIDVRCDREQVAAWVDGLGEGT
jgi:hypothetical protein